MNKRTKTLHQFCMEHDYKKHLLDEWDFEKNDKLEIYIDQVSTKANIKVWWKCKYGHEWESSVGNRANGTKCPCCSGKKILKGFNDLVTTNPELVAEWHPSKNTINPTEVSAGSNKKVWWICKYGHEWERNINNRTSMKSTCPYCAVEKRKKHAV